MIDRLKQQDVDEIRSDVCASVLTAHIKQGKTFVPVKHLRFPEPRHTHYILHDGNPPSDTDRHKHERGLRLELDIGDIPIELSNAVMDLVRIRKMSGQKTPDHKQEEVAAHAMRFIADKMQGILRMDRPPVPLTPNEKAMEETIAQADLEARLIPSMEKARTQTRVYPKVTLK